MGYVFDTNSLRAMGHFFPEQFPTYWAAFDDLVKVGEVVSVREVRRELEQQSTHPHLLDWANTNGSFFRTPNGAEAAFVVELFAVPKFREMVKRRNILEGRPVADPFIVAAGKIHGLIVVTEESPRPNSAQVPTVCEYYEVACTNLLGFMKREKLQY